MKTNIWYISCCPYINFLKHTVSKSILPSINFHKKIWKDSWRDQSGSYFGNFPNDLWPPPRFWRKSNSSQLFFIFFSKKEIGQTFVTENLNDLLSKIWRRRFFWQYLQLGREALCIRTRANLFLSLHWTPPECGERNGSLKKSRNVKNPFFYSDAVNSLTLSISHLSKTF